jgi:hypothetical protein
LLALPNLTALKVWVLDPAANKNSSQLRKLYSSITGALEFGPMLRVELAQNPAYRGASAKRMTNGLLDCKLNTPFARIMIMRRIYFIRKQGLTSCRKRVCVYAAGFFIGAILLLNSCAAPGGVKKYDSVGNEFKDLPAGALVYINVDVKAANKLVDDILARYKLKTKTVKTFIDMTDRAVIASYPAWKEGGEMMKRRFSMVGYGKKYPAGLSSFPLFFDPAWSKTKSVTGKKYWRSSKNNISLFMQKDRVYISDSDPFFIEDSAIAPESFTYFSEGSCISAWLTDITPINKSLERMDLPITIPATALFAAIFPYEEDWRIVFRIETPTQVQARGLVSVLSMVRTALSRNYVNGDMDFLRMLLSESPVVDGSGLVLTSSPLPQSALAGLIAPLSIYLK